MASRASVGHFYAGLDVKTSTYRRVRVARLRPGGTCLCRLVDYGDVALLTADLLRCLPARFAHLPAQALRARLAGVVPLDGDDWAINEVLLFQRLVDDKVRCCPSLPSS